MQKEIKQLSERVAIRFWSKVDIRGMDECWAWKRSRGKDGYGWFRIFDRMEHAQRIAFALTRGCVDPSLAVCHTCDNPPCCNPFHLFQGTQKDNVSDCLIKGRLNRGKGEQCARTKLTTSQVIEIRTLHAIGQFMGTELAKRYEVTPTCIWAIIHRKVWKHL